MDIERCLFYYFNSKKIYDTTLFELNIEIIFFKKRIAFKITDSFTMK